jgi:hypothetical protein
MNVLTADRSILVKKLADMVMAHEGGYDSVNRNTDGAGASIGIFQWPQRTGGLALVLREYHRANPELFVQIFGPHWRELLNAAQAKSMGPVAGKLLWEEPWVSRFQQAGRQPAFQAVQDRLAMEGVFMRAAFSAAEILGFITERSLAVTLDTAVSQGPEFAEKVAWRVRKLFAGRTVPMSEILAAYLASAVAHFRRTSPPTAPPKSKHQTWRKIGNEWHIYAGQVNLYRNIMNRRGKMVVDPGLSDVSLSIAPDDAPGV